MSHKNRCVIRLSTSFWHDKRGAHMRKDLNYIKRQCIGFNVLEEDCGAAGVENVIDYIVNLYECEDGLYDLTTCDESRDFETGVVDSYYYRLIPFTGPKP